MSLFKCPECGHDISTSALACPNCGWRNIPLHPEPLKTSIKEEVSEDIKASPPSPKEVKWWKPIEQKSDKVIYIIGFICLFIWCGFKIVVWVNEPSKPEVPDESYAALFIDEARDKILKSPASAQTVNHAILGRIVEHTQDGDIYKFLAYAEVDADNSFGAKIRSNFLIIFRMRGYHFDGVEAFQEYGQEIPSTLDLKVFEKLYNWPLPKK
jgi:hypothetical protein